MNNKQSHCWLLGNHKCTVLSLIFTTFHMHKTILLGSLFSGLCVAHMSMSFPPTRQHPMNPLASKKDDTCITSPLNGGTGTGCGKVIIYQINFRSRSHAVILQRRSSTRFWKQVMFSTLSFGIRIFQTVLRLAKKQKTRHATLVACVNFLSATTMEIPSS